MSLALIRHDLEKRQLMPVVSEEDDEDTSTRLPDIRETVSDVTSAIAPFLLAMIDSLSSVTGVKHLSASAGEAA